MRRTLALSLLLFVGWNAGCSQGEQKATPPPIDLLAATNHGVGLMGQFDFAAAHDVFAQIVAADPKSLDAQVNLGIAKLNRRRQDGVDDEAAALDIFAQVLKQDAKNLRARYCSGVLLYYRAKIAEALDHFRAVAEADPADAFAAWWTGRCLFDLGKFDQALPWFERSRRLDGNLKSAALSRFQTLQRLKREADVKIAYADFQQLENNPQARVIEIKYSRMGPKADVVASTAEVAPPKVPKSPVFGLPTPLSMTAAEGVQWIDAPAAAEFAPTTTACDIDGDGHLDLFFAAATIADGQRRNAVLFRRGEAFAPDRAHPLAAVSDVRAALWGDYDNDGLTDVYLCRRGPNQLWRQSAKGKWEDVTEATKTSGGNLDTIAGRFFDADHDGDLDILVVNADGPIELFNNNRDGTFRPLAQQSSLAGDGRPARQVVVVDVDQDRDLDMIVLREGSTQFLLNDRLWRYRAVDSGEALRQANPTALVAADANADGRIELYSLSSAGLQRWGQPTGGDSKQPEKNPAVELMRWEPTILLHFMPRDMPAATPPSLAVVDIDGDGTLDFMVSKDGHMEAVRRDGEALLVDGLQNAAVGGALVNLDAARGPSWVSLAPAKGPVIHPPDMTRYAFAAVAFSGKENNADQMRSNAAGIGTTTAVRVGARWTALHPLAAQSTPGQSLQPSAVGLAGAPAMDFIAIHWPDGVFQTELNLASGKLHAIAEIQRQTSSCPVLFAWDGTKYAFVTDLLGVGGLGFNLGNGQYAPPRPWENLLLPAGLLLPRDGQFCLKLGEPMEEACYLDFASLVAYDLPPSWQLTLDERFAELPPEPTGRPLFFHREWLPANATNDRGQDVTAAVTTADRRAAESGERDRRFLGRTREHSLTLRFNQPLVGDQLALVLDGWIEYPYSQTMFAAWQANAAYESATLEARDANGQWQVVLPRFGYPAGMPRQMAIPIPREKLPAATRELRLRTNVEVYWDRAAVIAVEPCPQATRHVLPLVKSRLHSVGFARRTTAPQRLPHYDYAQRAPLWDTRHQSGFYTSFGPVDELVTAADDAVAIFGPGEEVHLEFATPPPLAHGWSRRYVLETVGWCKDMDLLTRDGETVHPIPRRDEKQPLSDRARALHERYNTRYQAGP